MPSNLTTIPASRAPIADPDTGLIATEWYRFLFNLYTLSGSGSNVTTLDELQIGPPVQPSITTGGGGGGMVYPSAGIANSNGSAWGTSYTTTGTGSILALQTSPTLITPILGTPTSGNFSTGTFTWPTFNQNTTGYAASLAGGATGSVPYQSALNTTTFLAAGTNGQVLTLSAGVPSWATPTTGTVTSVTGTAPVVSSGGNTPAISMAAATGSVDGYLTSTDWTTFNSKQAALVSGSNIKTVGGVSLLGSGDVGTIGIGYGGTGQTTASAAFNALSPITTTGDLILGNGANSATRLPIGANTYVLTSNGTTATWSAPAAGGSNITAFGMWENKLVISANYSITSGNSALSAGPITINSGVTVTIPSGSRWVIA